MARLYADENFSKPVVLLLRAAGHDVATVQERGRDGSPDPDVLAQATAEGRAVLTFNRRHFWLLHRSTTGHAGIVSCTEDNDAVALAARIDAKLMTEGDLTAKLVPVTKPHPGVP